MKWKSRKPAEHDEHAIPNFMTARLLAPRNTAISRNLCNHGFEIKSGRLDNLIDIVGKSSFKHVNLGHGIQVVGNHQFRDYQEKFLHRVATDYSLNSITSVYEMQTNQKTEKSEQVLVRCPLTMDSLRVISKTYCSVDEDKRDNFLYRDSPTVNLVVVERVESANPLQGQLKIVLTSDPRGLALAFAMMCPENMERLPTEKDYKGVGTQFDFNFVTKLRDVHCLSKIMFILRIPVDGLGGRNEYEFYPLAAVQPCKIGFESSESTESSAVDRNSTGKFDNSFSTADVLAGVRSSMDQRVSACDAFKRSPQLPARPYPIEPNAKKFDPNKKRAWFSQDDHLSNKGDLSGLRAEVTRMKKECIGLGKLEISTREMLESETKSRDAEKLELAALENNYNEGVKSNLFFCHNR